MHNIFASRRQDSQPSHNLNQIWQTAGMSLMAAGKWLGSTEVEIADNATTAAAVKSWSLGDVAAAWASAFGKLQDKLKHHGLYVAHSSHFRRHLC